MKVTLVAALLATVIEPLDANKELAASVSITFATYSSDAADVSIGEGGRVRVEAVWLAMRDARVRPASACKSASARTVLAGTFRAELVGKQAKGGEAARLPVDRYCAFELQLRRSRGKDSGAPVELRDASIVVIGRRSDGARFVLRSRVEPTAYLRARAIEGFAPSAPATSWIVAVDVARWFAGVDLAAADACEDTRGRVVRIDETNNPELLATFNGNVEGGIAVFDDRDLDHDLDPDEQPTPIAIKR
jgi:hypothetical protein